ERFKAESEIWVKLGTHPNIVRAFIVDEIHSNPFVVMRWASAGNLRAHLGQPLTWVQVSKYATDFCRGMIFCQAQIPGFVHNDIKPENCLITPLMWPDGKRVLDEDGVLAVSDFGLATFQGVNNIESLRLQGTLPYM